jgi:voltage-gated potassium channel
MSRRDERRRLRIAIGLCLGVVVAGTLGMHWIEGWGLWEAFYFTIITVTTVGYGDHGASESGQQFATLLMLVGIGSVSYTFAAVVQGMVAHQLAWRRRMQQRIDGLHDHVILCGYGRIGTTIANQLRSAGRAFVVVDLGDEAVRDALEDGLVVLQGDATHEKVLIAAGLDRATHLVVAIERSSDAIVTALTARGLCPLITIIASADSDDERRKFELAGVDRTVEPFTLGGIEVAQRILRPKVADFLSHDSSNSDLAVAEVEVLAGSALIGCELRALGAEHYEHVSFVRFERPGEPILTPPRGTQVLALGDHLIVAGDPEQVAAMHAAGRGAAASTHRGRPRSDRAAA